MSRIDGYPKDQVAKARAAAGELMAKFDRNKDGFIQRSEMERDLGFSTSVYSDRMNDTFVWQTAVTHQNFEHIHDFAALDANKDGQISVEEVTEKTVLDVDDNKDGKLSWAEKAFSTWSGTVFGNVRSRSVEVSRDRKMVYDPLPQPVAPPSIPEDRPRPPSVSPSLPDRPRPPAIEGGRTRPPSI